MSREYSEENLENLTIDLFAELGYETADCSDESPVSGNSMLGRETQEEVILLPKLRAALERLNPGRW